MLETETLSLLVIQCFQTHSFALGVPSTHSHALTCSCQSKDMEYLLTCDDIKMQRGACFIFPLGAAVNSVSTKQDFINFGLKHRTCQPFKSAGLAPEAFVKGSRPKNCTVLNDLAEKQEPRSSLPCSFCSPCEHSTRVIIWQKTLWNRSDSCNYDEDEAWLPCRPRNFRVFYGPPCIMGGEGEKVEVGLQSIIWSLIPKKVMKTSLSMSSEDWAPSVCMNIALEQTFGPTNQLTNRSINETTDQPMNQWKQLTNQLTSSPSNWQTNELTNWPTSESISKTTNRSIDKPTDQQTNKPPTHSLTNQWKKAKALQQVWQTRVQSFIFPTVQHVSPSLSQAVTCR